MLGWLTTYRCNSFYSNMKNIIKNKILSNYLTLRRDKSSPCYTGSFFIFTCISSPLYLSNSFTPRRDKSILFTATVIFIIILSIFIAYNHLHILFLVLSLEYGLGLTYIAATMNSFPVRYLNTLLSLLLFVSPWAWEKLKGL